MGLSNELIPKLLLLACILGVLQGLLTFIGGIIACFDRNKDVTFKSHCSSMKALITKRELIMEPYSLPRRVQIAIQKIVTIARLIRQIEVGLRDIISFVSLKRMTMMMIAFQEVMPINLLCLLLLYVVFFGLQQEGFLSWLL